jgi:hypothetical protein
MVINEVALEKIGRDTQADKKRDGVVKERECLCVCLRDGDSCIKINMILRAGSASQAS